MKTLKITSSAFEDGFSIPSKYTCDGKSINPPLQISNVPESAKSLTLIMYDPDIPDSAKQALGVDIFVHWIKWNLLATTTEIKEGQEPAGVSGKGGSGKLTYVGPCPPDKEHRYFFQIYALDSMLNLPEGSSKENLEKAMEGHIIAWGELIGKYNKIKK
jgi:Raf kinase inhibitor-like YbhB/YbcL family protein